MNDASVDAAGSSDASNAPDIESDVSSNIDASATHEPSNMIAQIDTGPMTNPPATTYPANTWHEGTTTFTNFSPTTKSSTGEWDQNISRTPDGPGLRVTYDTSLSGGYSPVRFGASFADSGTGYLYLRWRFRLSANWTLSQASGLKVMEPRTVTSGSENHVVGFGNASGATDGTNMWLGALLQFSKSSDYFNVPGNAMGQSPVPTDYLSAVANVGGSTRGAWSTIEVLAEPESPAGAENGRLSLWVNGVLVFQTGAGVTGSPPAGMRFFENGEVEGWNYLMFDPTYGGDVATDHPPSAISWDIDELYVSVR